MHLIIFFNTKIGTMKRMLLNSKSAVIILFLALMSFSGKTFATIYYTNAAGAPETLANWWTNTNGTGGHPANFTTAGDVFNIQTGDVMTQAAATWTVTGTVNINLGGTLARGTKTFTCGALVIDGTMTNGNGGSTTVNGNVSGTGTLTTGTTARVFNVTGDWTFNGTVSAGDGISLTMNGTGNQLLSGIICEATANNGALIINKTSGTVTLGSNINVVGSTSSVFTLTAGTFDAATFLLTATTRTFTAGTIRVGATTWAGNFSGAITEPAGGTIEYYRSGSAQTVNPVVYAGNLILSATSASAKTTTGVTVNGTLSIEGVATVTVAPTYGAAASLQYKTTDVRNQGPEWISPWVATGDIFINLPSGSLTLNAAKSIANGIVLNLVNGTFAAGTNLTMSTTSSIVKSGGTMTGTLQGAGTYDVSYTGTSMSTSSELSGTGLRNVTLNLTAGNDLTLDVNRTMPSATGVLTLTSGRLVIPSGLTFTVTNTAAIAGAGFGATKCIVTQVNNGTGAKGFLRVSVPAATLRLMPVGDGTNYLPVSLTPANANTFDICVFNGVTDTGEPNGTGFSAGQKAIVVDAVQYVNLVSGAAGAGVTMTLSWPVALEGSVFTLATYNTQHGISHWGGGVWGPYTRTSSAAGTVTLNGITVFSPFNVGLTATALPLSFTSVNAAKGNGFNTVTWQATCNSSYAIFDVERSTDGRTFTSVNTITASQQRCLQPFTYADNTNAAGTVYYRIKNTDVDGKVSYSSIVKLTSSTKDMILVGVAPNPVSNIAQLSVAVAKNDRVELQVISVEGRVVQRSTVAVQAGTSIVNLDVANLQNGMYTIKGVFANGQTSTVRFMKQ